MYATRKRWCMLRDSSDVIRAIFYKLKSRKISVSKLSQDLNIDRKRIYALRNRNYSSYRPVQSDVMRICDYLGVHIMLTVEFEDHE